MGSTKVLWRVQVKSSTGLWKNKSGLFETRQSAREACAVHRHYYGFGNTRVVRYVRGEK